MAKTQRIGTWNVNSFNPNRSEEKARLLALHDWDVLLLQEVRREMWDAIKAAGWGGAFSLDQIDRELPKTAHGVAVVVKDGF